MLHGQQQMQQRASGGVNRLGRTRACLPVRARTLAVRATETAAAVQLEDKWLSKALAPFGGKAPAGMSKLHSESMSAMVSTRMPTTRNEEYRFTDMSALTKGTVKASDPAAVVTADMVSSHVFSEASSSVAVVVNGVLRPELSRLDGLPSGVYVGPVSNAPGAVADKLGELSRARGGPFSLINGAAARDVLCVAVPDGVTVDVPLYCLNISTGSSSSNGSSSSVERRLSAPRVLLHAGKESSIEVIEEYIGGDVPSTSSSGDYFTCQVTEVFLEERAQVKHGYVQREATGSVHVKGTLVRQAARSSYTAIEASLGGSLSRHDLGIEQAGEATETVMRHFLLCGEAQLHDLHSKLELNHPEGKADQLHKCIVTAASGRGVFDGNVKVNQLAQRTDAGQLSRNLLLVPRATVNVKPNLQIIADDVKCTHGCAISDLSEEELFYFRARGIDAATARQALVNSFGASVTEKLRYKGLVARIQGDVRHALRNAVLVQSGAEEGAEEEEEVTA